MENVVLILGPKDVVLGVAKDIHTAKQCVEMSWSKEHTRDWTGRHCTIWTKPKIGEPNGRLVASILLQVVEFYDAPRAL